MALAKIQQTTSAYHKYVPQLQVVGNKIYYTWREYDGSWHQIWMATSNLDGSSFAAVKLTTSATNKESPQLQVVSSTIYYVWYEYNAGKYQVWTATSALDGSSFAATQQTTSAYHKYAPCFHVVSSIYYTWREYDGTKYQIWTAISNLNGSGFTPTQQTISAYHKRHQQLYVSGSVIYYIWGESDGSKYQIWTALSNLDGSGFTATKQTDTAYDKYNPQIQIADSVAYYAWYEYDGANYQLWIAYSNLDGSGFTPVKQTTSAYDKKHQQFQVVGSVVNYVWYETDGANHQIWTALSSLNGSGLTPTKQTTTAYDKIYPQLQAVGSVLYYTWYEYDSSSVYQIWTARTTTPTVTTKVMVSQSGSVALGQGKITDLGSTDVTQHGHCWSTSINPTTADSKTENGAASVTGIFYSDLTSLVPGTWYYTRAYATNSIGTSYGANIYFRAGLGRAGYIWMEDSNFRGFDENAVERKYIHTDDVDDVPVDGAVVNPISSNWAHDHQTDDDVHDAPAINIAEVGTATYDDLQDFINGVISAGRISGGTISAHGDADGKVLVAAGTGLIKITDSDIGPTKFFDWAETTLSTTDIVNNDTNYIYVDYNAGSPTIKATTDRTSIKLTWQFTLGRVYRAGTVLHIVNGGVILANALRSNHERLVQVRGFERASGGVVTEDAGTARALNCTAGVYFLGANKIATLQQDTANSDRFTYWYHSGGNWTSLANQQTVSNTQYDNGADLANLGTARYGVFWVFIHFDGDLIVVYGRDSYKLADAEDAIVPALPEAISEFSVLAAKIIIAKDGTNFTSIVTAYETLFPVSHPPNHNDLGSLQGGTTDEYYHLTAAQHSGTTSAAEALMFALCS